MIWCDWGSSRLRAYLLGSGGVILDRRASDEGAMVVPAGQFGSVLARLIGDWRDGGTRRVLLSGMIGARGGWLEVPYLKLPCGGAELSAGIAPVPGERRTGILPGLAQDDEHGCDVMRGEETQVLASLAGLPEAERPDLVCLPGTHSKWVRIENGRIVSFRTHLTGELFALLSRHSIVGRLMPADEGQDDETWFRRGVAMTGTAGGIAHLAFTVRARALLGRLPPEGMRPFLSGLLIGTELHEETTAARPRRVALIGEAALVARYRSILEPAGIEAPVIDLPLVARGVARIAEAWSPAS